MVDFIVSGQVPGTHLQITFLFWQMLIAGTLAFGAVRLARRFGLRRGNAGGDDETAQTA